MAERTVQQYYELEDQFYEQGGMQTLDLSAEEIDKLEEGDGPIFLTRHNGFFALADDE